MRARFLALVALLVLVGAPARGADRVLFDFEGSFPLSSVQAGHTALSLVPRGGGQALRMVMDHHDSWPGIVLRPFPGSIDPVWDLGAYDWVAVTLVNSGTAEAVLALVAHTPGPGGAGEASQAAYATIPPGRTATLKLWFRRSIPAGLPPAAEFIHMGVLPGGFYAHDAQAIDPRATRRLALFALEPAADLVVDVDDVRAGGSFTYPAWLANGPQSFFPFIDRYGQFVHQSWPGKTTSDAQLAADAAAEAADLAAHPGPSDRDAYGGWLTGPHLPASGFFHPAKHQGKWWLVDPDGALFFSVGLDVVTTGEATPVLGRERFFQEIPAAGTALGAYRGLSWSGVGYYADKVPYLTYDFASANCHRKYGASWRPGVKRRVHERLRSWGLNTLGAWNEADIALMRRTPYTVAFGSEARSIEGLPDRLPDVFDPRFAASVNQRMAAEIGHSAGDPWCVGYFIDNEICWTYDEAGVALGVLASPADQPAKIAFVDELRAKYGTILALDLAWGTLHPSWAALLASRAPPERLRALRDLKAFSEKVASIYFRTCRAAVKAVFPEGLYLGCRFAGTNPVAVRAAAAFCDVMCFNYYGRDTSTLVLPPDVDRPVLIGEFHFGALDRGPFHATGVPVSTQAERGAAWAEYVKVALRNPAIVGCHWFQYRDQPSTGRFDGENANCGWVDITDQPYPEMVAAGRSLGAILYPYRYGVTFVAGPATAAVRHD